MCIDEQSNILQVESGNNCIRKITPEGGVSTFAGMGTIGDVDGNIFLAQFSGPWGIVKAQDGMIYISDTDNHKIKQVSPSGIVTTIAGSNVGYVNGVESSAKFSRPKGLVVDADGNLFVADYFNNVIRKITIK